MVKVFTVETGPEAKGETRVRRNIASPNELLTSPHQDVGTGTVIDIADMIFLLSSASHMHMLSPHACSLLDLLVPIACRSKQFMI